MCTYFNCVTVNFDWTQHNHCIMFHNLLWGVFNKALHVSVFIYHGQGEGLLICEWKWIGLWTSTNLIFDIRGSEKVNICVMSFMNDPLVISFAASTMSFTKLFQFFREYIFSLNTVGGSNTEHLSTEYIWVATIFKLGSQMVLFLNGQKHTQSLCLCLWSSSSK